ncbi:MAG: phytase [Cellvibrionaceae bacterium]|nr:phytase [Cellvibrionaceae bacterium]
MKKQFLSVSIAVGLALGLAACDEQATATIANPKKAKTVVGLKPKQSLASLATANYLPLGNNSLHISEQSGITLVDGDGETLSTIGGKFEMLDARSQADGSTLFVSLDKNTNQPLLLHAQGDYLALLQRYDSPSFNIDGLCLQQSNEQLFLYLLDGNGTTEQWLIGADSPAQSVRNFSAAPASYCAVDDSSNTLYMAEEAIGIWAYEAHPEAKPERQLVALTSPWGEQLGDDIASLVAFPGGIAALSPSSAKASGFYFNDGEAELAFSQQLAAADDPEAMNVVAGPGRLQLNVVDAGGNLYQWLQKVKAPAAGPAPIIELMASAETEATPRFGDVADDPAIWLNGLDATQSRVLGTNKTAGLHVYDLQGKQTQFLATGRVNNVDLRYHFEHGGAVVDIASASLRDDNSIAVYTIDRSSGQLSHAVNVSTNMDSIYGLCMYQGDEQTYVFANDKSGLYEQYQLSSVDGVIKGELVRSFNLPGQPEGCIADDNTGQLFMGEEDAGVWLIGAAADAGQQAEKILGLSAALHDDVEGMGLYHGESQSYLLVSSQGNDSYALFTTEAPYKHLGSFRIGLNPKTGIDGSSETDGLEVISADLGGIYREGMIVVQDGFNVLPSQPQNFKYLPWSRVKQALQLD